MSNRLLACVAGAILCAASVGAITIDGGQTRTVESGAHLRDTRYTVGATKATTSTLRVKAGGRILGQYSRIELGTAVGATGVVHLAGGEFPAWESKSNVTNMSHVAVGVAGAGFFTNQNGKVYLRESCELGVNAGSFGRFVQDGGEFGFCFGGKPFAVGVLGRGELEVRNCTMPLQDLLVGGTNSVESVVTVEAGATVSANARISVGGYTNRMNATCKAYPTGRGRIALRGGRVSLINGSATALEPTLRLGWYPTAYGEVRGWGEVTCPLANNYAYVGFGHGRVVGDGAGEERTLDCTDVVGVTNLFGAAEAGWYAENRGCLWLPRASVAVAYNGTANGRMGMTAGRSDPDLVNAVKVSVTGTDAATHVFCGGVYAFDRGDVHVADLPANRGVLGCWKLADCSTTYDWQTHPQPFKSCVLTFRYDAAKLTGDDPSVMLLRRENGAWRKLATAPLNDQRTIASPSLACLTGEAFNVGEFAIVEVETFRGNVRDPLARAADGWYEIGNRDYLVNPDGTKVTDGYRTSSWYVNMAYPDWRYLTLAAPKRVRFVGGVLLGAELPRGVEYDFSQVKSLTVTTNRLFADGTAIPVPKGAHYRFMPSSLEESATGQLIRTLDTRTGMNVSRDNLRLDGTMYVSDATGNQTLAGRLTGDGAIQLFNYYRTLTLTGEIDFGGNLYAGQVQNNLYLSPAATAAAHVGTVTLCGTPSQYAATQCLWTPPRAGGALTIDNLVAEGNSGWSAADNRRFGNALTVRANGTIRVGELTTKGSDAAHGLHLLGSDNAGLVDVSVGRVAAASRLYLAPRINLTVGTIAAASVFDCTPLGDTPNEAAFTLTGPHPATCRLVADTPAQLPQTIAGYTGAVEIASAAWRVSAVTNRAYAVPKGTILPKKGAIMVTLDSELPAAGRYAILTWAKGGALADAAAWTVTRTGRAELCSVERTDTGLYLVVPERGEAVTYYVDSEGGDDAASGLAPEKAWRTLAKVNAADIRPGERVLFRRGGLWRGQLTPKSGRLGAPVLYGAYGDGEKPILQQSAAAEAPGSWIKVARGVWRTVAAYPIKTCRDIGNIIFNHGEAYGWKRWSPDQLVNERDYWYDRDLGHVYLKSRHDPTTQWQSIELSIDQHVITEGGRSYVTYDGLAIRYGAAHGIGGGDVKGITVRNCDISWIGGGVLETKVNDDGSVSYTRYGNGIEFWGASSDCLVVSNRLWEIYDAAMTDQSDVGDHTNVTWCWNTVWNAEYSYEHFNRSAAHSVSDITVAHNTFVDSGGAWAHAQRPDRNGTALMIWHSDGPVRNFTIRDNIVAGATEQCVRQTTDWHERVAFSNNLFWVEGASVVRLVNQFLDFNGYKALGWDRGSAFGDPRFADAAHGDFRLRTGSPALGLASGGLPAGAHGDVVADRLYYRPGSTATSTNRYGRYVYSAENWTNAQGRATQPAAGNVLVVGRNTTLTADPAAKAVPLGGLLYETMVTANQGLFHFQAGGLGFTNACTSGSASWYCGAELHGDGDVPIWLNAGTALNLQRYFNQTDGGSATLVKRGGGTLAILDSSHHSPAERATWKRTRLEAGEFKWSPTGANGTAYDIQVFPVGHDLTFADDGTCADGATFSLGTRDCEWRDIALREASPRAVPRHVITCSTSTNVCLRFTGTPAANPLTFGGAFAGRAGLWWNPDNAGELRLVRARSTTTGDIRVSRGTVRLADGATFGALSSLTVEDGAAFVIESGAGVGFLVDRLALKGSAKVTVGEGCELHVRRVERDGAPVAEGTHKAGTSDWLTGAGEVQVGPVSGTRTVANAVLTASGDEAFGAGTGEVVFELKSKTDKGVLKVVCAPGSGEVSFHRPMAFHYAVDGEHGDFMSLPENATVNFYGRMRTSIDPPHSGPGYPNHWNYSCPDSCTVHWYGEMRASLNHRFPGGTHHVHRPLTGGDRFTVSGGARVRLLAAGNSIGGATGGMSGGARLYATVPYALDSTIEGRNQTLVFAGASTLDLCGHDQALAVLSSEKGADGVITSDQAAILHIRGGYVLNEGNGGYHATVTNRVRFAGRAGVSMERDAAKAYPLVLMARSESAGTLRVVRNSLVIAKGGGWPNCGTALIEGGELALEDSTALGAGTTVRFERTGAAFGKLRLAAGVAQPVARLIVDGRAMRPGTYGSSASAAAFRDDALFAGAGLLRVGSPSGGAIIVR